MKTLSQIEDFMLAPCGMDCGLCSAFQREKKSCPGCRGGEKNKPKHCHSCSIRDCPSRAQGSFCFSCEDFPCGKLKRLDARYRKNYRMSMLENLLSIKADGPGGFAVLETERWRCPSCGGMLCVHQQKACPSCNAPVSSGAK